MVIHYEEALYQVYGPLPLPVKKSRKLRHKGSLTCKQPVSTSASISGIQAVNCNTLYEPLSIYAASTKLQTHSCGLVFHTWSTARSHSDRRRPNHRCYHTIVTHPGATACWWPHSAESSSEGSKPDVQQCPTTPAAARRGSANARGTKRHEKPVNTEHIYHLRKKLASFIFGYFGHVLKLLMVFR